MALLALLPMVASCGALNPGLLGTMGLIYKPTVNNPTGTILIAILNTSSAVVAAKVEITKDNGGTVTLTIPAQPFDSDPANESDQTVVVQDCDVYSIKLVEILAGSTSGGTIQRFASDLPVLYNGVQLSCGKLVVITVTGSSPNLLANMEIF